MECLFQENYFSPASFFKGCVVEEGVDYRAGAAKVITQKSQIIKHRKNCEGCQSQVI